MKKVIFILFVLVAAVTAMLGLAGFRTLKKYQEYPGFLEKTTLNGELIEGRTPESVAEELAELHNTKKTPVVLREKEETVLEGTLADFGYTYDKDMLLSFLQNAREKQRTSFIALLSSINSGYDLSAEEIYSFDLKKFSALVQVPNLSKERVATVDNSIVFDEETNRFSIQEGSVGNMLDEDKLKDLVRSTLDSAVDTGLLNKTITIDIPDELYVSAAPAGDLTDMQKECDERNLILAKQEILDSFQSVQVTYTFGSQTEILDNSTIRSWISVDDSLTVTIDEYALQNFVSELGLKYDTLYEERTFRTSNRRTVKFSAGENEYGYRIDFDGECAQLYADIESGEPIMRDPVYIETNEFGNPYHYAREGLDDLAGTYVEVNLSRQHLWFYKNGQLVVESNIVSGSVKDKKETQTGVFALSFKESPSVLTGDEAAGSGSYSTTVQYWMPFYEGQGLHDASWRTVFGGNIYKTSGSHGCINLPTEVAKTIYENIEPGMAIIIYKE